MSASLISRLSQMRRLFDTLPLLLCRNVEIAIMVAAITTGYRLCVQDASGEIRTVPFAFTNTNKAGSAGNAGIRLARAGSTYRRVAGRGRSIRSSGACCIERDIELPRGKALPSPAPQGIGAMPGSAQRGSQGDGFWTTALSGRSRKLDEMRARVGLGYWTAGSRKLDERGARRRSRILDGWGGAGGLVERREEVWFGGLIGGGNRKSTL